MPLSPPKVRHRRSQSVAHGCSARKLPVFQDLIGKIAKLRTGNAVHVRDDQRTTLIELGIPHTAREVARVLRDVPAGAEEVFDLGCGVDVVQTR